MKFAIPLLALCLLCQPVQAAFKSASDSISPEKAYNPQPLPDDISLPMPCGLSMVLRAVDIPAGSLINDKTFQMGISNAGNPDRQLYERQFFGHIAAPFTAGNLPQSWRSRLPKNGMAEDTYYFIGKYEVSKLQWRAVMDALDANGEENAQMCPKTDASGGNAPMGGISWFDAQEFLNKYNAWLVKNHQKSLPSFAGTQNIAFLRLPTEEEWEYAARGGTRVPPEWWADKDIFPLEKDKKLQDYGVFHSDAALAAPAPIGSRHANPLGLHDTIGNLGEMVDGFFRMSIADMRNGEVERRLHGAAGGILTKGGSFRSGEDAVMPGWRDEVPLYTAKGPSRPADLGMRLVLAGLNIPSAQRLDTLRAEEKKSEERPAPDVKEEKTAAREPVRLSRNQTPIQALDAIAESADESMKASLAQLRGILADRESAEARLNSKNVEQAFRSLLYQSETLRAFALRYMTASREVEKIRQLAAKPMDAANREKAKKILQTAQNDLQDYLHSLQMGANYYKTALSSIYRQPKEELQRLFAQARREYGSRGVFDEHMRQNIRELEKNISLASSRGLAAVSPKGILKGILPELHYKAIEEM